MSSEQQTTSEMTSAIDSVEEALNKILETEQSFLPVSVPPEGSQFLSSTDENDWYSPLGVSAARHMNLLFSSISVRRFEEQVQRGFLDNYAGPSPSVRILYKQLYHILPFTLENLRNINNFLFLDERGMATREPIDTGDPQLNRLAYTLENRLKEFIKEELREIKEELGGIKEELGGIKLFILNSESRFENRFKGDGQGAEYLPITDKEGKTPNEKGLDELKSYHQIVQFRDTQLNKYLRFYDLSLSGSKEKKQIRLCAYLGVEFHSEPELELKSKPVNY